MAQNMLKQFTIYTIALITITFIWASYEHFIEGQVQPNAFDSFIAIIIAFLITVIWAQRKLNKQEQNSNKYLTNMLSNKRNELAELNQKYRELKIPHNPKFLAYDISTLQLTHHVLKAEDVAKALTFEELAQFTNYLAKIKNYRESVSKNPEPRYIILNTDEDPQLVNEVVAAMKKHEKWG